MIKKIICISLYHLGDIFYRLGDYYLYQYFMLKSVAIDEKNNLNIWKKKTYNDMDNW